MAEILFAILLAVLPHGEQRGVASTFSPVGDRWMTDRLACEPGHRWTDPEELLVAHRDLPCGTRLLIVNPATGQSVVARKADAGPWGALMPGGQWVVRRPGDPMTKAAKYRGVLDVSPGVARRIGLRGMGWVRIYWIRWPRKLL